MYCIRMGSFELGHWLHQYVGGISDYAGVSWSARSGNTASYIYASPGVLTSNTGLLSRLHIPHRVLV